MFFGLILTHDLIGSPSVRAECSRRIQQMLDYLIAHDWFVDEDRAAFDASTAGGFPTFYFGIPTQKIHYLLMGARLNPVKYGPELRRWAPLAHIAWLSNWTGVMDFGSYYKFNLNHLASYNYFRLETDPARWQDMARAFAIFRRYVGNHHNPHFNLVEASVEPSLVATYHPAIREALRQFVTRNHRRVAPPVVDLSGVQWVAYSVPGGFALPGQTAPPASVLIPSAPLDIPLRKPAGDFLWQRDPFTPANSNEGSAYEEKNGLDLVLPYWMARNQGAL